MATSSEKSWARRLQRGRGEGAGDQRALMDVRRCMDSGDDLRAFLLSEGATVNVAALVWELSPPAEEDDPLLFVVIEAPSPRILATLADNDDSPATDAAEVVRRVVPVEPGWAVDPMQPVKSVCGVLVDGFGWEVTLEPFRTRVQYSLNDDPLDMGARLRDALDRGWDAVSA